MCVHYCCTHTHTPELGDESLTSSTAWGWVHLWTISSYSSKHLQIIYRTRRSQVKTPPWDLPLTPDLLSLWVWAVLFVAQCERIRSIRFTDKILKPLVTLGRLEVTNVVIKPSRVIPSMIYLVRLRLSANQHNVSLFFIRALFKQEQSPGFSHRDKES